jgi:transcriptional regulator with XRE-family HTH domain
MTNAPPQPWPSLKRAVRRTGISYTDLAARLGISRQSVSAYARGYRRPSEDTIAALARVLGVPFDELRADVPFTTSPPDPLEMLTEIDGLVSVLSTRLETVASAFEEIKAKREQLQQLVQVPA